MTLYISLVRKNESLECNLAEKGLENNKIYEIAGKKYKCVIAESREEWTRRVNHIMEHGI